MEVANVVYNLNISRFTDAPSAKINVRPELEQRHVREPNNSPAWTVDSCTRTRTRTRWTRAAPGSFTRAEAASGTPSPAREPAPRSTGRGRKRSTHITPSVNL